MKTPLYFKFVVSLLLVSVLACTRNQDAAENSVTHAFDATVKGLDPIFANDYYAHTSVAQINEGLLHYHYLKRPFVLEPLLAESMPTMSKDGLTYTFKIKQGVLFQDDACFKSTNGKGRELVAEDFIYSWKRLADPKKQSDGWWTLDGKIKGLNEWREAASKSGAADYSASVAGLQAPDKYTLIIKLTKPNYQLLHIFAMSYTMAVPKEAIEMYGDNFLNHPVGTGPFKLKEWVRNNKLVFERNPNYRKDVYPSEGSTGDAEAGRLADAGKTIPFVDKVILLESPEDQPRWLNFLKGTTDYSAIPKDNYDSAIANKQLKPEFKNAGVSLQIIEQMDVIFYGFNMVDSVLGKSKYLRQALSLAIDRNDVNEKLYNGRAIIAHGPIPPGIEGYDPNFRNPYSEFNVAKAKELLKKAGYPDGKDLPELVFESTSSATSAQHAEYYQRAWAAIGVKLKINVNTWPQMNEKTKKKKAQIWAMAWIADYPDAENFLQLFYGPNESPGSNGANFKNAKFDELYRKASLLPPGAARTKLYHEMRDIVVEEAPWLFQNHRLIYILNHPWLFNLKHEKMIADSFKYLRVDPKKRVEMQGKL